MVVLIEANDELEVCKRRRAGGAVERELRERLSGRREGRVADGACGARVPGSGLLGIVVMAAEEQRHEQQEGQKPCPAHASHQASASRHRIASSRGKPESQE
jgi:hypothetical protein